MSDLPATIIAFAGHRCLGFGDPLLVATKARQTLDKSDDILLLIFDATTSRPVEIDLRGTLAEVQKRIARRMPVPSGEAMMETPAPRRPGRPKLGVVAREITLLPRHWEWLSQQPGGASVAIRKLVEDARRANSARDRTREGQESLHRFMTAMAGDLPHYEDALRSLYAGERKGFDTAIAKWPADVRDHVKRLAGLVFEGS